MAMAAIGTTTVFLQKILGGCPLETGGVDAKSAPKLKLIKLKVAEQPFVICMILGTFLYPSPLVVLWIRGLGSCHPGGTCAAKWRQFYPV